MVPELDERIRIRQGVFHNPINYRNNPFMFLYKLLSYLWSAGSLFIWLTRNRVDVIHQHFIGIDAVMLVLFKRLLGFRLVLTFHGLELELASESALSDWKNRLALRNADHVTAVSREQCDLLCTRYSIPDIHFIPNALGLEKISQLAQRPSGLPIPPGHFVYCGRVDPEKQVPGLVEAFNLAIQRGCSKNLYIMGDGSDDIQVQNVIDRFGIHDRVFPLGAQDRHHALRMIKQCRCLLLNSSSEGFPLVILEAMALGKPVVAPRVGGIVDMVSDGDNALLFAAGDEEALCSAIMNIDANESLVARLGENARMAIAELADLNTVVSQYLALYRLNEE